MKYKEILSELKRRFNLDQNVLKNNNKKIDDYRKITKENSKWLKRISKKEWLPREHLCKKGELYEWLIVQHSNDVTFQKKYLIFLENLSETKERNQNIAYLTDRILVNENKKQLYGTQFKNKEPFPIYNPENLNKRRSEMGLEDFNKYSNLIKKF